MNKNLWSCAVIATVSIFARGLTADTASPSPSKAEANLLTVRGCIRRTGDVHTPKESRVALSAPDTTTQFVLVRTPTKADAAADSVESTRRDAPPTSRASIYRLDDISTLSIAPHVGQEVEISGTLIDEERHDQAGATSTVTSPKLAVNSIAMVASGCPNGP
jgi:hypothetical protein